MLLAGQVGYAAITVPVPDVLGTSMVGHLLSGSDQITDTTAPNATHLTASGQVPYKLHVLDNTWGS